MIIFITLDDKNGMMFNKRRQSRDRAVIEDISTQLQGQKIWIRPYSELLFKDTGVNYTVSEHLMSKAGKGEYCFLEETVSKEQLPDIESVIVYRWNRVYPSDIRFDMDLEEHGFALSSAKEFVGTSHEKITREIWIKGMGD